jgi:Tfp pilus assembly protein PilO
MAMSEQQKSTLLLTAFAGVVGLILIAYFHFMLGRGIINDNERRIAQARKETEELKTQLAQINDLVNMKAELDRQAEAIAKVTRRLPSSPDAPGFLNALVSILGTTGIIQEEVRPDTNTARALYTEIPYKIKAQGRFHSFGQFLTLVEQNPERFMRVKNLTLTNNAQRPSIHPVELEIATFMFNE